MLREKLLASELALREFRSETDTFDISFSFSQQVTPNLSLDVAIGPNGVIPSRMREQLRDSGPSFRADLQRTPLRSIV